MISLHYTIAQALAWVGIAADDVLSLTELTGGRVVYDERAIIRIAQYNCHDVWWF